MSVVFFPGLEELIALYREVDCLVGEFRTATGLDCVSFCKKCCSRSGEKIEASVFELLPLSIHLWQKEQAEQFLVELDRSESTSPCPLYSGDHVPCDSWGCKFYPWRPLVCRLFGFSAVLDKHGHAKVALCKTLKEANPDAAKRIDQMIHQGLKAPLIPHLAQKASSLNPLLGQMRYPLARALRLALEKVGMMRQIRRENEGDRRVAQEEIKETSDLDRFL